MSCSKFVICYSSYKDTLVLILNIVCHNIIFFYLCKHTYLLEYLQCSLFRHRSISQVMLQGIITELVNNVRILSYFLLILVISNVYNHNKNMRIDEFT